MSAAKYTIEDALALLGVKPKTMKIEVKHGRDSDFFFLPGDTKMPDPPKGEVWGGPRPDSPHSWINALENSDCSGWRPMYLGEIIMEGVDEYWAGLSKMWCPINLSRVAKSEVSRVTTIHAPLRTKRPVVISYETIFAEPSTREDPPF